MSPRFNLGDISWAVTYSLRILLRSGLRGLVNGVKSLSFRRIRKPPFSEGAMDGRHVKVLGRGNAEKLSSGRLVEEFLEELCRQLGMRMLGQVHIYDVVQDITKMGVEPFEDEGGITGFLVLSTSHISMHTWPLREKTADREMFVLDVYSCRDFEVETVTAELERAFDSAGIQVTDLTPSLSYSAASQKS